MIDGNSNNSEVIPDQEEEIPEVPIEEINIEPIAEIIEEITIKEEDPIPKKKPGRPKEAKDKKPRPKRKVVIKEEPIKIQEELPRVLEDSLPIPSEPTTDKYALMLKLLHDQQQSRKNNKTELWKSWFVR